MDTYNSPQSTDYAEAIAALVAKMSLEQAVQVYNYVRFLQSQPTYSLPKPVGDEDWLNDSEEEMQAEDERWERACERHKAEFTALSASARAEIAAGTTQRMFTDNGELAVQ